MQGQRTRPSWQRSPKSGAHRRQLLMRSLSQAAQTWACSWRSSNCRAGPAGHPSDQHQDSCLGGCPAFDKAAVRYKPRKRTPMQQRRLSVQHEQRGMCVISVLLLRIFAVIPLFCACCSHPGCAGNAFAQCSHRNWRPCLL